MYTHGSNIGLLPHALADRDRLARHIAGRRPPVFLDYDATRIAAVVDALLADHHRELKVTPGKMGYEIHPRLAREET